MFDLDKLKGTKPGCNITVNILDRDGPFIMPTGQVCFCNRVADDMNPGLCDAICANEASYPTNCECKDPGKAGLLCDDDACKTAGQVYCKSYYSWQSCDGNANRGRMENIPFCPCTHGQVVDDRCQCDQHYSGTFCDVYNPPRPPPPIATPKPQDNNFNIVVPIAVIAAVVLITVIYALLCRGRRRRSYNSGYTVQTPVPGPPIPGSTVPAHQAPYPSAPRAGSEFQPYPPASTATYEPLPATDAERISAIIDSIHPPTPGGRNGYQRPSAPFESNQHEEERERLDQGDPPPPSYDEAVKQKD